MQEQAEALAGCCDTCGFNRLTGPGIDYDHEYSRPACKECGDFRVGYAAAKQAKAENKTLLARVQHEPLTNWWRFAPINYSFGIWLVSACNANISDGVRNVQAVERVGREFINYLKEFKELSSIATEQWKRDTDLP